MPFAVVIFIVLILLHTSSLLGTLGITAMASIIFGVCMAVYNRRFPR